MKTYLLLLLYCLPISAQNMNAPYGFQGDSIGENLSELRAHRQMRCSGDVVPGTEPVMPSLVGMDPRLMASAMTRYNQAFNRYHENYPPTQMVIDEVAKFNKLGEDRACQSIVAIDIAGAGGSAYYWIKADKLDRIDAEFSHDAFAQVRGAIVAKYGNPSSSEIRDYHNSYGAEFKGEVARWRESGDSVIELYEVEAGASEQSSIVIANPTTNKASVEANQAKANTQF